MKKDRMPHALHKPENQATPGSPSPDKQPWEEPKLEFVEPQLKVHGKLTDITGQGGFFGTFSPE